MSNPKSSYLKKLKFSPELKKTWAYSFLSNLRLIILLVITILIAGSFSYVKLPRRINPDVEIPYIFVSTIFPGASPKDVEQQVTIPLEEAIESVPGIKTVSSASQENHSSIVVEFESTIANDQATADIQTSIGSVTDLPNESQKPIVMPLDFEDVPVVTFALTSQIDPVSLMNFSRSLQKKLESLPEIQKVTVSGLEETELEIFIKPETYLTYRVSPLIVSQAVRNSLTDYPLGIVQTDRSNLSFSLDLPGKTTETLRNLPIKLNENKIVLSQIADISLRSSPLQANSFFADHEVKPLRTVTFSVFKTVSADLEESARLSRQTAEKTISLANSHYQMKILTDFSKQISDQFQGLIKDFSTSLFLVFLTLLIFLGLRQAAIASFVIPLSFLATFAAMYVVDIQLSFLSIFSLLLGLGMIVDDAIVMISAMTDYYQNGKFTPKQTAVLVWNDFWSPTLSSNLTNVWSFLPLLIATGIIGEFTKVISFVVTIALVASTAIALLVAIPFMVVVLKPKIPTRVLILVSLLAGLLPLIIIMATTSGNPFAWLIILAYLALGGMFLIIKKELKNNYQKIYRLYFKNKLRNFAFKKRFQDGFLTIKGPIYAYKKILKKILRSRGAKRKIIFGILAFSIFSYLLVPLGLVQNEFFPKTDEDNLYLSLELPVGTSLEQAEKEGLKLLEIIRSTDDTEYVLADIGADIEMGLANQINQSHKVRFSLKLREDRKSSSIEIAQDLREKFSDYTLGKLQIVEISGGPPTGADIEMTLLGEETIKLQELAQIVQAKLESHPGTTNVNLSIVPGLSKLVFVPTPHQLYQADVSIEQMALTLRTYLSGMRLDTFTLQENGCQNECPIQLRLSHGNLAPQELSKITLSNNWGESFNLLSLGELKLNESPTKITRVDGQRSITISASVLPDFNKVQIGQELEKFVDQEMELPANYSWQTGGANQENESSVNSIIQAMILAIILILATMVVELKSFRQAVIVMLVIPLAISGVFIVFGLTGTPLSFPALIGILALFGIVVKNSIMIVDKINRNLKIGLSFDEAIADGASSRLEPIIFSSVTNIIGLTPITLSDPMWRGLGGAIISGLTLSGIIMLFFIPLVYDAWYRKR
ncbi:efflux RND transporter permease subunit [Patescibacteria group bacterium]